VATRLFQDITQLPLYHHFIIFCLATQTHVITTHQFLIHRTIFKCGNIINYNILTEKGVDPSSRQIRTAAKAALPAITRKALSKFNGIYRTAYYTSTVDDSVPGCDVCSGKVRVDELWNTAIQWYI